MPIELVKASSRDDTTIRNLYQLYIYEFTRFMTNWHTNYAGRYTEDDLDEIWHKPNRHTFLVKVEGELGGFAIVDHGVPSRYWGDGLSVVMVEFFILAAFQGQGIAEQVAIRLFDMHPGKWEIFELEKNVRAQHFWRRTIRLYTNGQFREVPSLSGQGIVQLFDNSLKSE
jgi:predicted acetyltransferase